jgi:DnaD/phage-associated family protein
MNEFRGFPNGRVAHTPLPDLLFSELLPLIDDLAELKVTLHVLWRLYHKKDTHQYVTQTELLGDGALLRSLQALAAAPEEALHEGLRQAVARGTLLYLEDPDSGEHVYLANSARGRRSLQQALLGEWTPAGGAAWVQPAAPLERPNIFELYEQNIALLQPIIAEELKEAEQTYPADWIEDAFRIAVENNVRSWKYISRILERWASEGKDAGKGRPGEGSWYEEYGKLIKR